jgi:hypothetical protein
MAIDEMRWKKNKRKHCKRNEKKRKEKKDEERRRKCCYRHVTGRRIKKINLTSSETHSHP